MGTVRGRQPYLFKGNMTRLKIKQEIDRQRRLSFMNFLIDHNIDVPVAEFKFHPKRKWKFDYAWPAKKIALEIEGGIYGKGKKCPLCKRRAAGAHSSVIGILRDIEKYNEATIKGWKVIRVLPQEVMTTKCLSLIKSAFSEVKRHPNDVIEVPFTWEDLFEINSALRKQIEAMRISISKSNANADKSLNTIRMNILSDQNIRLSFILNSIRHE